MNLTLKTAVSHIAWSEKQINVWLEVKSPKGARAKLVQAFVTFSASDPFYALTPRSEQGLLRKLLYCMSYSLESIVLCKGMSIMLDCAQDLRNWARS
jgi:hypothetical protein